MEQVGMSRRTFGRIALAGAMGAAVAPLAFSAPAFAGGDAAGRGESMDPLPCTPVETEWGERRGRAVGAVPKTYMPKAS